jgi:cytochrome c553
MKPFVTLCAAAVAMVLGLPGVLAAAEGDPVAGREKTRMCAGCHGISGYKAAFPVVYSVPKLGGQHAAYVVKALQAYKSGERPNPTMRAIAAGLTDKDMADLAAYYAGGTTQSASR